MNRDSVPPSLLALRGEIDAVDAEIVRLMGRRQSIVERIAAFKQAEGLPVRDEHREAHILRERPAQGASIGLQARATESVFRVLLTLSRERQAALRAGGGRSSDPKVVSVIGGKGMMGALFAGLFGSLGHRVIVADLGTEMTASRAAAQADVVIVSVPIDVTERVIAEIGPLVRPGSLLMDLTSVKEGPVRAMLGASNAEVIGAHPLFGPSVHSVHGQRIVLTPARGGPWLGWLRSACESLGMVVVESTPREHDRAMAIVQVLTHFSTEVMGRVLQRLDAPIERTLDFTSPVYLMELLMTARHFAQSADLYASIQMTNERTPEVTRVYAEVVEELRCAVTGGDREAFRSMFAEVRGHLGAFSDRALEQSSWLIDRLVERA